jgi:tellurite resistance protein TerC
MSSESLLSGGFIIIILSVLLFDLLVVGRNSHVVKPREALIWTSVWVCLALLFYFILSHFGHLLHSIHTPEKLEEVTKLYNPDLRFVSSVFEEQLREYRLNMGINYVTGYIIEQTLSIDNVFVMLILLQGFGVALKNYKRVLFWGILGAIVLRFIFIFAGSALVQKFDWILLIFGAFLVYQSIHLLVAKDHGMNDPQTHPVVRFLSKRIRLIPHYVEGKFWTFESGKLFFTPLFVVLIMIEFTDLIFAFDSIPAVFAVTRDPFVVFFSNIFAIIGLRSLFFLLAGLVEKFRFLKHGVSLLLAFVGFKLLFHAWLEEIGFKSWYSLIFIGIVLLMSVVLSVIFSEKASVIDSNPYTEK